ncbi:MAG: hypothetical protein NTV24_03565 [Candidatus Woesebacteria bacterium]|nr:hypothetical protein [Candidatus Woesebacteria bacterium]
MLNIILIYSVGLLAVLSFALGIYSILINPKPWTVRMWFLLSMAISLWSANLFLLMYSKVESDAILYSKILHVGASFIPIFFCHFVLNFTFQIGNRKKVIFLYVGYLLAVIFSLLSLTPLIVAAGSPKVGFPFWVDAGKLYPLLLIYFWVYVLAGIYFLYQAHERTGGTTKKKTFYLLVASIIAFVSGGTSFLPQTLGIYPFGDFITWLYPVIVTYGIFIKDR